MYEEKIIGFLKKHSYKHIDLKSVLFDMDGVLFDSMPHHAVAWHTTMARNGMAMGEDEAYLHEGRTGAATINLICKRERGRDATGEEKEKIYQEKTIAFNQFPQAPPMKGAVELLNKIKEDALRPVLVTGSGQASLLDRLETSFPGVFTPDLMVTAYDVKYGKPDPEPYLMGLEKAGVAPNEAVVIENAPLGVQSAVAAGIFTIAVNTGPLNNSVLWEAGADLLFNSMETLFSGWEQLYKELIQVRCD